MIYKHFVMLSFGAPMLYNKERIQGVMQLKRFVTLFAVLALVFSLAACNTPAEQATDSATTADEPAAFSPGFDPELRQYCSPWTHDVIAEAVADGKIHYYFMSSKGMMMYETEKDPYKWGDSSLIVFPNGQTMLVDTGMSPYMPVLVENLRRMGVTKLDYLLVSHPHGDHCHGITRKDTFFKYISVDNLLWNGVEVSGVSSTLRIRCLSYGVPMQVVKKGDTLQIGEVRMTIMWPLEDAKGTEYETTEEVNNSSIVARFDYKEHSSLFVGDLYVSGEEQVLDLYTSELKADLLKVPHHGYETSSSTIFAFKVKPELAVAMGAYRAPVENRYKSIGSTYLNEKLHGYIHVSSDGNEMTYEHQ